MIVTFCGHSRFPRSAEYERRILDILESELGDRPVDFYLGDYGDFDTLAYDCCKMYSQNHKNASLIFITPYITPEYQKNHLEYKKERFDGIIYPEIEDRPLRFALTYRNRWMVEKSDLVIAGIFHSFGGAYQTYKYAKMIKKRTLLVTEKEF